MATKQPLYSIVLAHYKQLEYIFTALDSVLMQSYGRIELVVVDDGTPGYEEAEIYRYIEKNKGPGLERVAMVSLPQNAGTVRALNNGLAATTGDLLHLFAADDMLAGENVVQQFVDAFEEKGEDTLFIAAMADLYDEHMAKKYGTFTSVATQKYYDTLTAQQQFEICCKGCLFPVGASCMRQVLFQKCGPFNEEYQLVEDWPFQLSFLRAGFAGRTVMFSALKHRDGGVSHAGEGAMAPHELIYRKDLLRIKELEIVPSLAALPLALQAQLYVDYFDHADVYKKHGGAPYKGQYARLGFLRRSPALLRRRIMDAVALRSGKWIRHFGFAAVMCLLCGAAAHYIAHNNIWLFSSFFSVFSTILSVVFAAFFALALGSAALWLSVRVWRFFRRV